MYLRKHHETRTEPDRREAQSCGNRWLLHGEHPIAQAHGRGLRDDRQQRCYASQREGPEYTYQHEARQPKYSPTSVPRGIPNANAIVSPPVTVARALPLLSGAAMLAATTAIVGVNTAAAHAATTLEARSGPIRSGPIRSGPIRSGPIEESTTTATLAVANTARERR